MLDKNRLNNSVNTRAAANSGDITGAIMEAFNAGRLAQAGRGMGEIIAIESSSLLDTETCNYCRDWDGKRWTPGSSDAPPQAPPYKQCGEGYGKCRCLWVFIYGREPYVPTPEEPVRPPTPPEPEKPKAGPVINTRGNISEKEVTYASDAVDNVPSSFKNGLNKINLDSSEGYSFNIGKQKFKAGGDYSAADASINMFGGVKNREQAAYILGHEIGHHAYQLPSAEAGIPYEFWIKYFDAVKEEGCITPYARDWYAHSPAQGQNENFAEWTKLFTMTRMGFSLYGEDRYDFERRYPQQYKLFSELWEKIGGL